MDRTTLTGTNDTSNAIQSGPWFITSSVIQPDVHCSAGRERRRSLWNELLTIANNWNLAGFAFHSICLKKART